MRVAVVVVTWNALALTRRCLAALGAQATTDTGLELDVDLLVVDNASDDGTAEALRSDGVEVLALPRNTGFAGGAAAGIAATGSEVVVLVNNDAVAAPGYLLALVAPLVADDKVGAVTGRVLLSGRWVPAGPGDDALVAADGARWRRTSPQDPAGRRLVNSTGGEVTVSGNGRDRDWLAPADEATRPAAEAVFGFTGGSVALRRAALVDVGSFDPDLFLYYEDTELSWRLRRRGWEVRYAAGAVTDHDHAASSGTGSDRFRDQNEANRLRVAVRHAPWSVVARACSRAVVRAVLGPDRWRRWRVLGRVTRVLPAELRARRRIDATATVPRAVVARLLVPDGAPR